MPTGPQQAKIAERDCTSPVLECGERNTNDEPPPDIQLLGATAYNHLLSSQAVVVKAFTIQL